ncbi:sn-glycerol-3-phosphate import ATP-binding protein UgpC [Kiloniella laminariae]|uniref:Sn-glycerol-3-phosphate import ATP-binding protein UgpC n=1 Tax=Kiloniella laminariae TaxID=454162 RepID=A0ABT4LNP6_9PROT|nr:sn-glycerol-3-phosphate import ATP-binding protein UgpC [Kiloniella laminariae]MCZ4282770.1 sn-glycerol-3-phosphate import ATP-binding protein UgpC [Kiloniella laminariae]
MSTVTLKDLKKTYANGFQAIHGIDMEIRDGEFIVIVGPSGCGKSTLLRMIAGLETITDGELMIDDRRVNQVEPGKRDIAMVFQNYALYPHMSVYDNMAYGLKIRKKSKEEIEQLVNKAADILEIGALLDRKPSQLSGGQRQRVAMGRAIVRDPKVFLFDEPLSNLDAKLRVQMRIEIRKLQRALKTTAIYVTHDQVEAMTLADRLIVMNGGLPEQIGSPMELYDRPSTTFVAGFIGSPAMNFIPIQVDKKDATLPSGQKLNFSAPSGHAQLLLGIRPEDIEITTPELADLTLKVSVIEPLGADSLIYGSCEGMKEDLVVRVRDKALVQEEEIFSVRFNQQKLHYFDPKTNSRLP